jgi:hypothetical protein
MAAESSEPLQMSNIMSKTTAIQENKWGNLDDYYYNLKKV